MTRKLFFVESASEMGGVEFSTLYLATHLNPNEWQVLVICPGEGRLATECRLAGLAVEIIRMPGLIPTSFRIGRDDTRLPNPLAFVWNIFLILGVAIRLWSFLGTHKPDIVLTKGLYAHFCAGLAARVAGRRCIWHVQDLISERFGGLYRSLFGIIASLLPNEVVADGSAIAGQMPAGIQQRVHVVLNGINVEQFRPGLQATALREAWGIGLDALVIGHAARVTPWKGQHHLIEAFALIAAQYPQTYLVLVGSPIFDNDAYGQRLRFRVRELGLDGRVIFAGFRSDLPLALNAMDIFAYTSVEKDTSPLALLSALACGLPVAAFDIDGVREVLGEVGVLVPVRDENQLAQALKRLLMDTPFRERLAGSSREMALQRFSLQHHLSAMQTVFGESNK